MVVPQTRLKKARSVGIRSSRHALARTLKTARAHSRFSRRKFLRQAAGAGFLHRLRLSPFLRREATPGAERCSSIFPVRKVWPWMQPDSPRTISSPWAERSIVCNR